MPVEIDAAAALARRSRSTTSPAGRGRRSCRSRSCRRSGRCGRPTSTCARSARGPGETRPAAGPTRSAAARSPRPSAGCASGRRRTAPGAGSSRPGSGRSSCSPRSATASRTRRSAARSRAGRASRSTRATGCGPRRASRRSGTPALAVLALRDAGVPADHPALRRAGDWLLAEEVTVSGDWAVRRPELAPGGWAFEFQNDLYPDVDDTAVVALALRELGIGDEAVERGLDWIAGMQSRGGGWGAFDVDNDAHWLYRIPFCDFGRVTDEPSADVTAHALEALAPRGRLRRRGRARRSTGCSPSRRTTAPGSAAGASTTSTAPAPRCPRSRPAAIAPDHPAIRRARRLARLGAERGRRLRRGHPLLRRPRVARPRDLRRLPRPRGRY